MAASSKTAVTLAVLGNGFLTVTKFVAFAFSGSGAMLSEAIHSLADTGNQALLFVGIRRSELPADSTFHYGFGAERFFFALMSAVGIFVLGCGVTVYHGVHTLLHPPELTIGWMVFAVLGLSLVVDGFVLWKAVGVVQSQKGDRGFFEYVRRSSDPTLAAVLLEDAVACIGVLVAAIGIGCATLTDSHVPDAVATLIIGGMMGLIAVWLGYKNRSLILGPAIPSDVQQEVLEFLRAQPSVEHVYDVKTRVVGADRFRFKAEVDWNGRTLGAGLEDWVLEQRERLGDDEGLREFAREFGERITEALGDEIDRIEVELFERHPELRHVDLESD